MINVVPVIVGAILLAMIAVVAVGIAKGAIFPKCPGCNSRRGVVSQDDVHFTCAVCGEQWRER